MKRGLIAWDKHELPPKAFESRLAGARNRLEERGLPALVVYSDLGRSNHARFYSNFMPYFNRAFLIVPREDKPFLLCGLSPRVYPWIKSVTILDEILLSPNLAQTLLEVCAARGWSKIGMIDPGGLPYGLHLALQGKLDIEEVPHHGDHWEQSMYARAAQMAREGLEGELPAAVGLSDHEFVGRLERKFRRAGAEDLVILLANGTAAPAPAKGQVLEAGFAVSVDLEYRGHWTRLVRRHGLEASDTL
jgi:hypothetical protein